MTIYNVTNSAAWAGSNTWSVGDRVINDSPAKLYQCTTGGPGAASGGPTGTGASISDGSAVWKWLVTPDYTSWNSLSGVTLSQASTLYVWYTGTFLGSSANSEWTAGSGGFTLSPGGTSGSNTLLVTAAAGDSFVDKGSGITNLRYDKTAGVAFRVTDNYSSCFTLGSDYITVKGLQFKGKNQSYSLDLSNFQNVSVANCIVDAPQTTSFPVGIHSAAGTSNGKITNTLIIVENSPCVGFSNNYATSQVLANCTIVKCSDSASASPAVFTNNAGGIVLNNCALFGFNSLIGGSGSVNSSSNSNCTDQSSGLNSSTNMLYSKTYANQFTDTTIASGNFKLKIGSNCIDSGFTDSADISPAVDIVGTSRPQGSSWDIGAWELASGSTTMQPAVGGESFTSAAGSMGLGMQPATA